MNPNNVVLLTSEGLEAVWMDTCPSCKAVVSAIKHDFSLCGQLQNALFRIRELESVSWVKRFEAEVRAWMAGQR